MLQGGLHYAGVEALERNGQLHLKIPIGGGRVVDMSWREVARVSPEWLVGFYEGFWV